MELLYCNSLADELAGFEKSWRGNAKPGWSDGFNRLHNAGNVLSP